MMERAERLDYEILDCALNRAIDSRGYPTTVTQLLKRLRELFPDLQPAEFIAACRRLRRQDALHLHLATVGVWRDYRESVDDEALLSQEFWLRAGIHGPQYFRQLSALIEVPPGFLKRFGDPR